MEQLPQQFTDVMVWLLPLIVILSFWEIVWKIIAMWKSARNNDLVWFIFIAVFNTLGILPIIYILLHKKKNEDKT
jgi:TRAP-type mannitol/chloroaromatic compound transport system permease small subunit